MSDRASVAGFASVTTVIALILAALRGGGPPGRPVVVETAQRTAASDSAARGRAKPSASRAGGGGAAAARPGGVARSAPELLTEYLGHGYADPAANGELRFRLRVLIATVPDPVDSHLDWAYDAGLEAIRRAAERSGYTLDRFWLPAPFDLDTVDRGGREVTRPLRATTPGVLLFRAAADTLPVNLGGPQRDSSHALLVVYVVPEVPTAGVAKGALRTALDERDALVRTLAAPATPRTFAVRALFVDRAERDTVRIVGPFWSGAAVSLRTTLDAWDATRRRLRVAAAPPGLVDVVSGTATGDAVQSTLVGSDTSIPRGDPKLRADSASRRAFAASCVLPDPKWSPAPERLCVAYRHVANTNAAYAGAVFRVTERMGIARREMAVLQEMSPYGQTMPSVLLGKNHRPLDPDSGWIRIPFPMNISYLRAEYARLGAGDAAADPQSSQSSLVRVSLLDSARAMENPAVMSRDLTNAAVEVALDDIGRTLAEHRIRAVLIVATDVRDKIFLATELRRRVRDLQIILYGTNSLLVRGDRNRWLRGTIVASTYPLFLEDQFWDARRLDRYRSPFPNDLAEGLYNAVLLQLGTFRLAAEYGEPADPFAANPPVWATLVGAKGFAPLLIASHGTAAARDRASDDDTAAAYRRADPSDQARKDLLETEARGGCDRLRLVDARDRRSAPTCAAGADNTPGDETLMLVVPAVAALVLTGVLARRGRRAAAEKPSSAETPAAEKRWAAPSIVDRLGQLTPTGLWNMADANRLPHAEETLLTRAVHRMSLGLHHQLYLGVRAIALLGFLIPAALVPLHHRALRPRPLGLAQRCAPGWWPGIVDLGCDEVAAVVLVTFAAAATTICCARCVTRALASARGSRQVALFYALRGLRTAPWPAASWLLEIVMRVIVGGAALLYALSSLLFVADVWRLRGSDAMLFFHRYAALDNGVSPAIPLMLVAASYCAWTTWHVRRTRQLMQSTAFEEAQLVVRPKSAPIAACDDARSPVAPVGGALAAVGFRSGAPEVAPAGSTLHSSAATESGATTAGAVATGARVRSSFTPASAAIAIDGNGGVPRPRSDEPIDVPRPAFCGEVRKVRLRLFRVFPTHWGGALVGAVLLCCLGLWRRWTLSYEAAILTTGWPWGMRQLLSPMTSFDVLFRLGALALVGATALGLFRFVAVWSAFRRILAMLAETPLLEAYRRLPLPVARLGRLTPFGAPPKTLLESAVCERWVTMRSIYDSHLRAFAMRGGRIPVAVEALMALHKPPPLTGDFEAGLPLAAGYLKFHDALKEGWLHALVQRADATGGSAAAKPPSNAFAMWLAMAEECAAAYSLEYVEWVFNHLRHMAFFILCSLVLGTVLLSSYPFQPQSLVQMLFFLMLGAGVVMLVVVAAQMNRDLTLSSINGSNPNHIDFDATFLTNLALFGAVPVFTLVSTQFPQVREFLFSWVAPLLRSFGSG